MSTSKLSRLIIIFAILFFSCKDKDFFQEVPYVRQGRDSNCYQACLMMMLKKFFPEEKYTSRDMDRLTRRKPNHWTFEAQLVPALLEKGLEVKLFATTEYNKISPEYVSRNYGAHVAPLIDYGAVRWARGHLKPEFYSRKALSWAEVERYFRQGYLAMLCVEENALWKGAPGRFSGHAVLVVGVSGESVYIHDPKRGPNLAVPEANLVRAWEANGTDRAVLFVREKP
jgi:hypothetical protein